MSDRKKSPCVLLISPGIIKWTDTDFGLPHLVAIGGYLQHHLGVRVEILDVGYEGGDHRRLMKTIEGLGPVLLVGLSCYSSYDYLRTLTLARFLRANMPGIPIVTGGYHVSALPHDVIFDGSPFDAAIVGEGEVPMKAIVEALLGGGRIEKPIWGPNNVEELDTLPPYRWELLGRYWPRAYDLGRKLQVYLSRGCPYHCTFCMERAKTEYRWRSYSPERAVDELVRLSRFTDLSRWVVNLADPLFGFARRWRRTVLEGLIARGVQPRQFWTLTRSDDLEEDDVRLLARARFSIGIGAETASPEMILLMQKARDPERYLAALERLAGLSLKHGLNWAANIIIGHPGETLDTMRQTHTFLTRLFTSAKETCGWLSFDPFRLYPGALVHEQMEQYAEKYGTRFHHPDWWKSWYDAPFRAEHVDPSTTLDFEGRVRFMYDAYAPLAAEIQHRFRGQGRSVDRVFERSLGEQAELMSTKMRDRLLTRAARAKAMKPELVRPKLVVLGHTKPNVVHRPLGLMVRDPWVRKREDAVRRLLEEGVLRTERLIDALLAVAPEKHLSEADAEAMLLDRPPSASAEGRPAPWLGIRLYALGLEALAPGIGDRLADLTSKSGYLAAVLSELAGDEGEVTRVSRDPTVDGGLRGEYDGLWIGGALPSFPRELTARLRDPRGRAITFIGPRFRPQDMVVLSRTGDSVEERILARIQVPVLAGKNGWVAA